MFSQNRLFHTLLLAALFSPTLGLAQSGAPSATPVAPASPAVAPSSAEPMDLPSAISSLNSDNALIRQRAVEQILASSTRERGWVPQLEVLLRDSAAAVRAPAAQLLGEIGAKEAVPNLLPLTKDSSPRVRQNAVKALALLEAREAIPNFVDLLGDESEEVALEAIAGLQHFGDDRAVKGLTDMMVNGQSYRLRKAAIRALGDMHSSQPVSQLIVLLEYERDIWLRLDIAQTLGKIGDDEGMKPILRFLEEVRKEENAQVDKRRKKVYGEIAEDLEKLVQGMRQPKKKPAEKIAPSTRQKFPTRLQEEAPHPSETPAASVAPLHPSASATPAATPAVAPPAEPTPETAVEVEKPKPLPKKMIPRLTKKKAGPGTFSIQIKATNNADIAKAMVEDLKTKGVEAQITQFQKDQETWYRVRVGSFASRQAAEEKATQMRNQNLIEDFFITK